MICFFLFLVGCDSESEPTPQTLVDQQAYLSSVSAPDPEQGLSKCLEIEQERLKGECVLFAAKEQAQNKRPALAFCGEAPTEGWKSACAFEVSDMAGLTGQQADMACQMAGEFQSRCMYHALQREEGLLNVQYPPGREADLMQAILDRMDNLGAAMIDGDPLHVSLTARIISRRFQAHWKRDRMISFGQGYCGNAPDNVCIESYRLTIKMVSQNRMPTPCPIPMSDTVVAQAGLPLWEPTFEEFALEAWSNLCRRASGTHHPPDHRAASGQKNTSPNPLH